MSFERQDLALPMHDGTVGRDGSLDDLIVALQFYYYDLRFLIFIKLLSNTDEGIGFYCTRIEADGGGLSRRSACVLSWLRRHPGLALNWLGRQLTAIPRLVN